MRKPSTDGNQREGENNPAIARERQLRQSIEIMNHLMATSARPRSVELLRKILHERARANVKGGWTQNSLPDLF
ncbi:MAG TPA: hypothetical protein V6C52_01675 [Coleofasciculaceae cyanobacterium]|jgi:hypothetical protein